MSDELPQIAERDFTERTGIIETERVVNAARCIWREIHFRDVGIDGHIEHVNSSRRATGRLVLVQVKSGSSYFRDATSTEVPFTPAARHSNYWERAPLPVILVLHNPDSGETIWINAQRELKAGRNSPIRLRRDQVFDKSGVLRALATDAPLPTDHDDPSEVVRALVRERHSNPLFPLSFFDLFVNGLTDVGVSLYFGMDLASEVSLARVARAGLRGNAIASTEYEFLDRYVEFVIANDLARLDFDWWVRLRDDRGMVATLLAPLTRRGRSVVSAIVAMGGQESVRERFVQMVWSDVEVLRRLDAIDRFVTHAVGTE